MGGSVAVSRELPELLLREPRQTLAVAESVTAEFVQAMVAAVSGAFEFSLGGVTTYTLEQEVKLLVVYRAAAKKINCVINQLAFPPNIGAGLAGRCFAPGASKSILSPASKSHATKIETELRALFKQWRLEPLGVSV